MPPFGSEWFRPLSQEDNLLGIIRNAWIQANVVLDREDGFKDNKLLIEILAAYVNPESYWRMRSVEEGRVMDQGEDFKVIYDTSDFTRRLNLAKTGEVEINEQREDISVKVKEMRRKIKAMQQSDPRISVPVDDDDFYVDTGPIVERTEAGGIRVQIERPKMK